MLIVYWPITIKFGLCKQTSKPQINYRCCLRFSYLVPYWLISRNTITFHKYFRCSRFCEFQGKVHWNPAHMDTTKTSGSKSAFIIYVLILRNLSETATEVHLFFQFQYWSMQRKRYRNKLNASVVNRLWIWLLHRLSKCHNTLPNSNLIWKAWTCLNEFWRTPKCFVGKQITSTITLPVPPCWLLILIIVLIHTAWSNNQESL